MTSPSTQNLKALGLRVFFLICCLIFSFLPNVGLRLTLEYLTISSSNLKALGFTLEYLTISSSNLKALGFTLEYLTISSSTSNLKALGFTLEYLTISSSSNLKALGLRVLFLICCLTFSFLPNVGLRLTLEYLTISSSSVSPSRVH